MSGEKNHRRVGKIEKTSFKSESEARANGKRVMMLDFEVRRKDDFAIIRAEAHREIERESETSLFFSEEEEDIYSKMSVKKGGELAVEWVTIPKIALF